MDEQATRSSRGREQPPPAPRWVKILALVGVGLLVLLLAVALAGGEHGPGRHMPGALGGEVWWPIG